MDFRGFGMSLYPHQEKFIADIRGSMKTHRSVLAVAPTGMGKTVVATYMAQAAMAKGSRIMFMVHRKELIDQTSATFMQAGLAHSYVAAGYRYDPAAFCHILSVGSMARRMESVRVPDILVVDESHHASAGTWAKVIEWAKAGGAYIIGLTATPWRSDGKGFREYFDAMVLGPETSWLIENGYLSRYRAFAPSLPDLSGVGTRAGDYAIDQVDKVMQDAALYGHAVDSWRKHAVGKKTIAFCTSVDASKEMARRFQEVGVSCAHLDAETPKDERRNIILDFANGRYDVLTNVALFTEGFDLSALAGRDVPIEACILYRPTKSLALYRQMVGRALRRKDEPAIIFDHGNNIQQHGLPDDEYPWSLDGRKRKESEKLIKICPKCFAASYGPCSTCEPMPKDLEPGERLPLEFIDAEMQEVDLVAKRRAWRQEVEQAKTMDELRAIAVRRKYKIGWAWHQAKLKGIK